MRSSYTGTAAVGNDGGCLGRVTADAVGSKGRCGRRGQRQGEKAESTVRGGAVSGGGQSGAADPCHRAPPNQTPAERAARPDMSRPSASKATCAAALRGPWRSRGKRRRRTPRRHAVASASSEAPVFVSATSPSLRHCTISKERWRGQGGRRGDGQAEGELRPRPKGSPLRSCAMALVLVATAVVVGATAPTSEAAAAAALAAPAAEAV